MSPDLEPPALAPAGAPDTSPGFFGRRWALGLGTVLLAGLALVTLARWQEGTAMGGRGPETVVQRPVPSEPFPSATRSDTTAPDPGDNPP